MRLIGSGGMRKLLARFSTCLDLDKRLIRASDGVEVEKIEQNRHTITNK